MDRWAEMRNLTLGLRDHLGDPIPIDCWDEDGPTMDWDQPLLMNGSILDSDDLFVPAPAREAPAVLCACGCGQPLAPRADGKRVAYFFGHGRSKKKSDAPQKREAIRVLFARGHSIEAVAVMVGVSTRTVRRHMS